MDPDLMTEEELAARAAVFITICPHCGQYTRVDIDEEEEEEFVYVHQATCQWCEEEIIVEVEVK